MNIDVNAHSNVSVDTIVVCQACGEITFRAFKPKQGVVPFLLTPVASICPEMCANIF